VGLGKLPPRIYTSLESSGVFGPFECSDDSRTPADWLFQHFLVFIEALDKFKPVSFNPGKAPQALFIWVKDGVCKHPSDPRPEPQVDDPRGMIWLLKNRKDFGSNAWDEYLRQENIKTWVVRDALHHAKGTSCLGHWGRVPVHL